MRVCGVWVLGHLAGQDMASCRQGHPITAVLVLVLLWGSSEGQRALAVCRICCARPFQKAFPIQA